MSEELEITILNWEKNQPKSEQVRHPHWFKLKNDTPINEALFDLTAEEKWVFICLLCIASRNKASNFKIKKNWLSDFAKVKTQVIEKTIEKLCSARVLTANCQSNVTPLTLEENRRDQIRREEKRREADNVTQRKRLSAPDPVSKIIGIYYRAYESKYGIKIRLTGKDVGILKRLVGVLGEERLSELIQVYLQTDDPWFEKKHHDLVTFESNLNAIQVAHGTGKTATQRKKEEIEKQIFGEECDDERSLPRADETA